MIYLQYALVDAPGVEYEQAFHTLDEAIAFRASLAEHMVEWTELSDAEGEELLV